MNFDLVEKIEIATDCDNCEREIEVIADYFPAFDSVEYVCPLCDEEGAIASWKGSQE